jgi:hypothetical protein
MRREKMGRERGTDNRDLVQCATRCRVRQREREEDRQVA